MLIGIIINTLALIFYAKNPFLFLFGAIFNVIGSVLIGIGYTNFWKKERRDVSNFVKKNMKCPMILLDQVVLGAITWFIASLIISGGTWEIKQCFNTCNIATFKDICLGFVAFIAVYMVIDLVFMGIFSFLSKKRKNQKKERV